MATYLPPPSPHKSVHLIMILFAALPFSFQTTTSPNNVSSDTASGRFRCLYCAKEFGRGDVCRKHMLNCIKKDTDSVIPELRRGRKPKACEACFASKVSCDKGHPCSRCLLRHISCRSRTVVDGVPRYVFPKTQALPRSPQSAGDCRASGSGSGSSRGSDAHAEESMRWIKGAVDPRAVSMMEHTSNDRSAITERTPGVSFPGSSGGPVHSNLSEAPFVAPDLTEFYPWNYATVFEPNWFNFEDAYDITVLSLDEDPFTPIPERHREHIPAPHQRAAGPARRALH
ncbi:hypothetical protein MY3296_007939 [Beauveria thailandica]